MYDVIVHDDIFCTKEKRRQLHSTKSNMTTHLPPICPYTPPLPRPGASKYRTKPFASSTFLRLGLHYSIQTTGATARHLTGAGRASYVTRDGMTRTSNSLFTAALRQHERESMTTAGVVVVECIAMAVASVCGNAGAKVSPARRRAHKIVEMLRWQQWTGEYGGVDGDPGSSDGSASWRRRRA